MVPLRSASCNLVCKFVMVLSFSAILKRECSSASFNAAARIFVRSASMAHCFSSSKGHKPAASPHRGPRLGPVHGDGGEGRMRA